MSVLCAPDSPASRIASVYHWNVSAGGASCVLLDKDNFHSHPLKKASTMVTLKSTGSDTTYFVPDATVVGAESRVIDVLLLTDLIILCSEYGFNPRTPVGFSDVVPNLITELTISDVKDVPVPSIIALLSTFVFTVPAEAAVSMPLYLSLRGYLL